MNTCRFNLHPAADLSKVWGPPLTMKPLALIERTIENSFKVGDVGLDLFPGSGLTVIACDRAGRVRRSQAR